MSVLKRRYQKSEFAARGEEIFNEQIRPKVEDRDSTNFVLIDIETGDFEVDADETAAAKRLRARRPNAQVWMRRVGSRFSRRIGSGHATEQT